jgi:hypothetical protein
VRPHIWSSTPLRFTPDVFGNTRDIIFSNGHILVRKGFHERISKHIELICHCSYQTLLLLLITCGIVLEFQILFFLGWKLLKLALRNSCLITFLHNSMHSVSKFSKNILVSTFLGLYFLLLCKKILESLWWMECFLATIFQPMWAFI